MNHDFQKDLRTRKSSAATALPPALVEETGWDILLALHSDRRSQLSLEKLAALVSVSQVVMSRWLPGLEKRRLITGATDSLTGELRAVLTSVGRELLERYLTATSDLQVGTHP